ncbi:unnamed protein product [Cylindrotheca closterium]|uniref:Uncharacterized protein n=1 Tax=Cylindrotheca closterium TaxID=2856 RepID=A0AAD2FY75_9STRA|nr:unnamed protein product [Cylindrotheca closterium]
MKVRLREKYKGATKRRLHCWLCLIGTMLMITLGWGKRILMQGIILPDDISGSDRWIAFTNLTEKDLTATSASSGTYKSSVSSLPHFLQTTLDQSDFVELDHCDMISLNWTLFQSFAEPVIQSNLPKRALANDTEGLETTKLRNEWTLELLELYLTHNGKCQFDQYRPRIKRVASIQKAGWKLQEIAKVFPVPPQQARVVFSIVAYKDSKHLRRLIEAIHLPHHLIIIHLEQTQQGDESYHQQVEAIANDYQNVVVVQFGTIIYKTDSISRVTLQLMYWITTELKIKFDYFASLGGAVYPLFGALELSKHLYESAGNVWLGEATMKGRRVEAPQTHLLWKHRLLATSTKLAIRTGTIFHDIVPDWMTETMRHKSNSGNQAIFGYSAVEKMLQSEKVLQIFAMAKYSCCCCVEERTWIAAMDIIGFLHEARKQSNMFQLWGGEENNCVGSMNNAVLDLNENRCFRIEALGKAEMYFWGNQTWDNIVEAKKNGMMFARKFSSDQLDSIQLLEKIRKELHLT